MTIVLKRHADIPDPMLFDVSVKTNHPTMLGYCYQYESKTLTMEFSDSVDPEQVRVDTGCDSVLEVK